MMQESWTPNSTYQVLDSDKNSSINMTSYLRSTTFPASIKTSNTTYRLRLMQESWIPNSTYQLPDSEKKSIIRMSNDLRSTIVPAPINMNALVFNDTLEQEIIKFLNARNANWVFENDPGYNNTIPGANNPMNGLSMLQRPEFAQWAPYCTFWVHDTEAAHSEIVKNKRIVSPVAVQRIYAFRVKQQKYFKWSACLDSPDLPSFLSCIVPQNQASAYTNYFLVRMLLNFDSVAVVGINHAGPFTPKPKKQRLSFWGWACLSSGIERIPTNGYPYEAGGPRASACDAAHPIVKNGLCTKNRR